MNCTLPCCRGRTAFAPSPLGQHAGVEPEAAVQLRTQPVALHKERAVLAEALHARDESAGNEGKARQLAELQLQVAELTASVGRHQQQQAEAECQQQAMLLQLRGQPSQQTAAAVHGAQDQPLQLQSITHAGQALLLDPGTGKLYQPAEWGNPQGSWPQPVGWQASDGSITLRNPLMAMRTVFGGLQAAMQSPKGLAEAIGQADADSMGSINEAGLLQLLRGLLPQAAAADLQYMACLVGAEGQARITLQGVQAALADSLAVNNAVANGGSQIVQAQLQRVRHAAQQKPSSLVELHGIYSADRGSSAPLGYRAVMELVQRLVPGATAKELRYVVAQLHAWDVHQMGAATLEELQQLCGTAGRQGPASQAASGQDKGRRCVQALIVAEAGVAVRGVLFPLSVPCLKYIVYSLLMR